MANNQRTTPLRFCKSKITARVDGPPLLLREAPPRSPLINLTPTTSHRTGWVWILRLIFDVTSADFEEMLCGLYDHLRVLRFGQIWRLFSRVSKAHPYPLSTLNVNVYNYPTRNSTFGFPPISLDMAGLDTCSSLQKLHFLAESIVLGLL